MTLETAISYLWHDMPLTYWGAIFAGAFMVAGVSVFFKGRRIMRANLLNTVSVSTDSEGVIRRSISSSSADQYYAVGKSMANLGFWIVLAAGIAITGFLRIW